MRLWSHLQPVEIHKPFFALLNCGQLFFSSGSLFLLISPCSLLLASGFGHSPFLWAGRVLNT
jgi:hypothetical protein